MAGHIVGSVGMKDDRVALPFYRHGGVKGLACRVGIFEDQIDGPAREEKLPESARVRKKGLHGSSPQPAADQEPVGPVEEGGNPGVPEDAKRPCGPAARGLHSDSSMRKISDETPVTVPVSNTKAARAAR